MVERIQEEQVKLITWSVVVVASFVAALTLYYTRNIMIPFVLALVVTTLVSPIVDIQVARWKIPRWAAVSVVMLLVLAVIGVFGLMIIIAIQSIASTSAQYSEDLTSVSRQLLDRMHDLGMEIDKEKIIEEVKTQLPAVLTGAIGSITHSITGCVLVLVFCGFLLAGRSTTAPSVGIYHEIDSKVRKYLAIKVGVSAITGLAVWILLSMLGLRWAFVFGLSAFMLNFVPSVGSIVAVLLPIPVAIAQSSNPGWILLVIALPGAVQLTMGNVIEPKLQGAGLKLHPVVILLSLALWGLLWGIAGMVLAVPMTAILRIVLLQFETTRPLGDLLAGELPQVASVED